MNTFARFERKLPEMTAPIKGEAYLNDPNTDAGRHVEIARPKQQHEMEAHKLQLNFQNLRTLTDDLPDSLVLSVAEIIKPEK